MKVYLFGSHLSWANGVSRASQTAYRPQGPHKFSSGRKASLLFHEGNGKESQDPGVSEHQFSQGSPKRPQFNVRSPRTIWIVLRGHPRILESMPGGHAFSLKFPGLIIAPLPDLHKQARDLHVPGSMKYWWQTKAPGCKQMLVCGTSRQCNYRAFSMFRQRCGGLSRRVMDIAIVRRSRLVTRPSFQ